MPMKPTEPLPVELLGSEVQKIGEILVEGSDLTVALVASSFLDECLRSLLSTRLRPGSTSQGLLRSGRGVLGTYSARTDLAYSLGLIDEHAFKSLRTVGEIRNTFAHSYDNTSFNDPRVACLCVQLDYAYELFVKQGKGGGDSVSVKDALDRFFREHRNRFTYTCVTLGQTLIFAARAVKKQGVHTNDSQEASTS